MSFFQSLLLIPIQTGLLENILLCCFTWVSWWYQQCFRDHELPLINVWTAPLGLVCGVWRATAPELDSGQRPTQPGYLHTGTREAVLGNHGSGERCWSGNAQRSSWICHQWDQQLFQLISPSCSLSVWPSRMSVFTQSHSQGAPQTQTATNRMRFPCWPSYRTQCWLAALAPSCGVFWWLQLFSCSDATTARVNCHLSTARLKVTFQKILTVWSLLEVNLSKTK